MNKSRREGEGASPDVAVGSAGSPPWGTKLATPVNDKGPNKPSDGNESMPRTEIMPQNEFQEEGE